LPSTLPSSNTSKTHFPPNTQKQKEEKMPHLFSRLHKHKPTPQPPQPTTPQPTKSPPPTTTTTNNPLQPLAKNRTVGPEVSKMREWDWADTKRKDSGTGAAFLEDVRMQGTASPKSSIAAGADGFVAPTLQGLNGVVKKSSLSSGGGTL